MIPIGSRMELRRILALAAALIGLPDEALHRRPLRHRLWTPEYTARRPPAHGPQRPSGRSRHEPVLCRPEDELLTRFYEEDEDPKKRKPLTRRTCLRAIRNAQGVCEGAARAQFEGLPEPMVQAVALSAIDEAWAAFLRASEGVVHVDPV